MTENPANLEQRIAETAVQEMFAKDRASQCLGMHVLAVRPGYAQVKMMVRSEMLNGHAICHGGLVFSLADSAFAFACNSYNAAAVAASCVIDFLAPARGGDELTAEAVEQAIAGRSGVYDVTVCNQRGERIALMRGRSRRVLGDIASESG